MIRKKFKNLEEKFGLPLYLFNEKEFCENYGRLVKAMTDIYPQYRLAYSYKTNYTPYICKLVKSLGGYAEVVSDMEYLVARHVGYDDNMIIYNGPVKGPLMDDMLLNGGIVNIDNKVEAVRVVTIARKNRDKRIKVGLRLNVDVGQGFISRFGIDSDSSEVEEIFDTLNNEPNITVAGIHMHVGRTRNVDAWHRRAVLMIEIADKLFEEAPEFIDLGSGMFGTMEEGLAKQFGDHIPTFEEYAEAVARPFMERYGNLPPNKLPILFTEPGTTIANRYVDFIAQVQSIKEVRGKTFIALNCSVDNIGTMSRAKIMPLSVISNGGQQTSVSCASLVGYTCLENDVMYKEYTGKIGVGDFVVFGNVGGYSNVSKPPFILWNCPMIAEQPDGNYKIIKRQEKYEDIFNTYIL